MLDAMNSIYMSFFQAKRQLKENEGIEDFTEKHIPFFLHVYLQKLNRLFSTYKRIVICQEGINSTKWRKEIYPAYKQNRDEKKDTEEHKIFVSSLRLIEEIFNYYPCKVMKVDNCESDDVIFTLSVHLKDKWDKITVLTTDRDLVQIINHNPKAEIFNPITSVYYEADSHIIERKSIVGDTSDNIQGLYRVGEKTFEKMLVDNLLWQKKMNEGNNFEVFEKTKQIVDLSKFPDDYRKEIIKQWEEKDFNEFKPDDLEVFFWENKLSYMIDKWGTMRNEILVEG